MRQILNVVSLDRVLIERIAASAADAQILCRLQERRSCHQFVQLRPQAIDDLRRADLSLIEGLKRGT